MSFSKKYTIEQVSPQQAEQLCRQITADLPEYFGLPECNEHYALGTHSRINFAAKIAEHYVGLLSLEFPYPQNSSIYWMGVLREHQGFGVGHLLMQEAIQHAQQLDATTLTVETLAPDESDENYLKTYAFYKKMGFHPLFNLKPANYEWNMVYMAKNIPHEISTKPIYTLMTIDIKPEIIPATLADYSTIQNMARFYVYDMSRYCGSESTDWACPADGLYESYDFKIYFEDPARESFLIKINDELAGFVLLNKIGKSPITDWNMGEFFILARFQRRGIGDFAAHSIWKTHPGQWEVSVIPENQHALRFWRKSISSFTDGNYTEEIKTVDYDSEQPQRYILTFDTNIPC